MYHMRMLCGVVIVFISKLEMLRYQISKQCTLNGRSHTQSGFIFEHGLSQDNFDLHLSLRPHFHI